jgi:hypothetical protein
MRQIRISKRQRPARRRPEPLPPDARDPDIARAKQLTLEPADQPGGGVVGGYLAGQPDVDLDRRMVIRANVNDVGPAENQPPDRLSDHQAEQRDRAAGADWPTGIKWAQPPWPALIDADDSGAVARPLIGAAVTS